MHPCFELTDFFLAVVVLPGGECCIAALQLLQTGLDTAHS